MKPPLLLLHGAIGAASQFAPLHEVLRESFTTHSFDFEGHGEKAFANRPFRIEQFAENLASFIDEHNLQPCCIFGYSMGGYVALHLAATKPQYIKKIYTLATKFNWSAESAAKESAMLNPDKIIEKIPAFAQSLDARHIHGWKENLQRTAEMMHDLGESPALNETALKKISVPCRIAVGDADTMVTREETEKFSSFIQDAAYRVLHNTLHPLEKINPSLLKQELEEFFIRA